MTSGPSCNSDTWLSDLGKLYMGGCQNYGPFLGPCYNTGPNTGPNLGDPKRDFFF